MSSSGVHHPLIQWAQRHNVVLVTVPLQDVTDLQLRLVNDTLALRCTSDGKRYETELPLYGAVSAEESSSVARPRQIEIRIQKKEPGWWPRLTASKVSWPCTLWVAAVLGTSLRVYTPNDRFLRLQVQEPQRQQLL